MTAMDESQDTRRTTVDLIEELEDAAKGFTGAALAVGFAETTEFVMSCDDRPIEKLNAMVRRGGEPIGIMLWKLNEREGSFCARPLPEHDEPAAHNYLLKVLGCLRDQLVAKGAIPDVLRVSEGPAVN
jgi:hypothetical protein